MTTETTRHAPQLQNETSKERTVQGKGRFAEFTFGYGDPQKTVANVLGSSPLDIEWNRPQSEK